MTDEKNVGFLADAWRSFTSRTARSDVRGPGAVFVVAGGGNLDEFRRRAGPGVQTLGPCDSETLAALYRRADLFWTASTAETLGQVVLEAQACGVPVLVADRGAVGENVVDHSTGRILPVDSPERWAGELKRLLDDPGRRARMAGCGPKTGRGANDRGLVPALLGTPPRTRRCDPTIARPATSALSRGVTRPIGGWPGLSPRSPGEEFTGSSQSLRPGHPEEDTGPVLRIEGTPTVAALMGGTPAIHVSDFHAGSRSKKIPKEAAFRAVCQRVVERGARLFLHGDFLDTRPPLHKFRKEVQLVRNVLDEFGIVPELYLEGNHDYEFARDRQIENLLGCAPAPSLVHHDHATGLVLTHGHVSEVPGIQQLIARAEGSEELLRALSVDRLQQPLRVSALKYDLVGIVTNCARGRGAQRARGRLALGAAGAALAGGPAHGTGAQRGLDDHVIRAVIHMIGSSDREEVLSQLCGALGGWGLVYGHTHEPHVSRHRVIDPLTGEPRTVLLGNCGSFQRKSLPPTWIESDFPHLELWAFDPDGGVAELVDRASLLSSEVGTHERLRAVAAGC